MGSWEPGFDGGSPQTYYITYSVVGGAEKTVSGIPDSDEDRMQYKLTSDISPETPHSTSIVTVNSIASSWPE